MVCLVDVWKQPGEYENSKWRLLMNQSVKISVITVCYNSEKTIEKTLESMLAQTYANYEYIIVDGASTDRTLDIVNKYREKFGERLKIISEPDDGIYDAMNKGIRNATGEIVGIINSDDYYESCALEEIVKARFNTRDVDYAIYHGKMNSWAGDNVVDVSVMVPEELDDHMGPHPSCFVTRKTYEDLGMFDTKFKYVADYDFMLKMYKSGKVKFIPVDAIVANFTLGGACSTHRAYLDLLTLRKKYGHMSGKEVFVARFKAKLAKMFENMGLKPIRLKK